MDQPHAIVELDGRTWDSWKRTKLFERVTVELTTGEASEASWELFDPDFQFIDNLAKDDGVKLASMRFWLGFGPDLGEPVFKGLVARVERRYATSIIRAYDMGYKMRQLQKAEYHKGDDLAIIKKLVERNSLKFIGPATPLKLEPHKAMKQDQQTDWQHVAERAHDAGLLLWVRDDTVFAEYPAKVGVPKLTLTNRKDRTLLRDFNFEFKLPENKKGRPKGIEMRGRGRGGKRLSGSSDKSSRGHEELSLKRSLALHTKAYATARAQAQKELDREHAFHYSVSKIALSADDKRGDVRDTIRLLEFGKLFSGDAIADKATYDYSPGHLNASFELHRDVKE
jgi:hypothetical protein